MESVAVNLAPSSRLCLACRNIPFSLFDRDRVTSVEILHLSPASVLIAAGEGCELCCILKRKLHFQVKFPAVHNLNAPLIIRRASKARSFFSIELLNKLVDTLSFSVSPPT